MSKINLLLEQDKSAIVPEVNNIYFIKNPNEELEILYSDNSNSLNEISGPMDYPCLVCNTSEFYANISTHIYIRNFDSGTRYEIKSLRSPSTNFTIEPHTNWNGNFDYLSPTGGSDILTINDREIEIFVHEEPIVSAPVTTILSGTSLEATSPLLVQVSEFASNVPLIKNSVIFSIIKASELGTLTDPVQLTLDIAADNKYVLEYYFNLGEEYVISTQYKGMVNDAIEVLGIKSDFNVTFIASDFPKGIHRIYKSDISDPLTAYGSSMTSTKDYQYLFINNRNNSLPTGYIDIYKNVDSDMVFLYKIPYPEFLDTGSFGHRLSCSDDGTRLAVSYFNTFDMSDERHGGVIVYLKDQNDIWNIEQHIACPIIEYPSYYPNDLHGFGWSILLNSTGDKLFVHSSNRYEEVNGTIYTGSVFYYTKDIANTWSLVGKIERPNRSDYDQFGSAMSISSDDQNLIIGSQTALAFEVSNVGLISLFKLNNGTYQHVSDGYYGTTYQGQSNFGCSVDITNEGTVAAGSYSGVYIFKIINDVLVLKQSIKLNRSNYETFGQTVKLSSDGNRLGVKIYPYYVNMGTIAYYQRISDTYLRKEIYSSDSEINTTEGDFLCFPSDMDCFFASYYNRIDSDTLTNRGAVIEYR